MTDDTDEQHQPPLTLSHKSFVRGELEGKPCIVIYDSATDTTAVIAFNSKFYAKALTALTILEVCAAPSPKKDYRNALAVPKKPKLILPGTDAQH